MTLNQTVKIFHYLEELDAFTVTDEYNQIAHALGLHEWNPVVWIGRLFILDNDYGEHWFDNWDLRENIAVEAQQYGLDSDTLLIINPERFQNGYDGPVHSSDIRKLFWIDVLKSLELSYSLLCQVAKENNDRLQACDSCQWIPDLSERIQSLLNQIENS